MAEDQFKELLERQVKNGVKIMGLKRRFKIKKQQCWKRRKERKKLATKNTNVQPSQEKTENITPQQPPPTQTK